MNHIHNSTANTICTIADDVLRDVYVRGTYKDVILPMVVIRRFDALLEPTKQAVLEMKEQLDRSKVTNQDAALSQCAKQAFYNSSPFTLRDLQVKAKQQRLQDDFKDYLDGFSSNVQDILQKFDFNSQIPKLVESETLGPLIDRFLDPSINVSPNPVYDADGHVILPGLDNHAMGAVFEELVRRFNEEGGEDSPLHDGLGSRGKTQQLRMKRSCPCCKMTFDEFIPISERWRHPFVIDSKEYHANDCEGGDAIEIWSCPSCKSNPRTRLYYLYMEEYFSRHSGEISILHIAPEIQLVGLIFSQKNVSYRSMDLVSPWVHDNCDIRNMSIYLDAQFDFVICSQVLEHVEHDDDQALKELYRVMSFGGKAIISVPLMKGLDCTHEDETIATPEGRKRAYGDETHYRFYTRKDLVEKMDRIGFLVEDIYAEDLCGRETAIKFGISPETTFFLVRKNAKV